LESVVFQGLSQAICIQLRQFGGGINDGGLCFSDL